MNGLTPYEILDRVSADIETLRGYFTPPDPDASFKPQSFETASEAIEYWGLPTELVYAPWDPDIDTDIGQALDRIGTNAVLVLEERTEPYPLDSSGGFPAYNVTAISGPNGTRTAITNKPARWFEMARGNILGLGPGAIVEPTDSGWTAPAQPKPLYYFDKKGKQAGELVGNQNVLIGSYSRTGVFCNFTLRGRDFGDVVYSGLKFVGCDLGICKGVIFDEASRGRDGLPNLESGALDLYKGCYELESIYIVNHEKWSSSPIMWNRTKGGALKNVKIVNYAPHGMPTLWACGGRNDFENFFVEAWWTGLNIEECLKDCEIHWKGGAIHLNRPESWHLNINPANGSIPITLTDVEISPDKTLVATVYGTTGVQRASDVTYDRGPITVTPKKMWAK